MERFIDAVLEYYGLTPLCTTNYKLRAKENRWQSNSTFSNGKLQMTVNIQRDEEGRVRDFFCSLVDGNGEERYAFYDALDFVSFSMNITSLLENSRLIGDLTEAINVATVKRMKLQRERSKLRNALSMWGMV